MKIYEVRNQDSIHYVTSKRAAKLMKQRNLGQVREVEFDLTKHGIAKMLNSLGLEPWEDKPGAIRITANKPPEPDPAYDEPEDQFLSDAEADADTLKSAGFGTDEDYGPHPI